MDPSLACRGLGPPDWSCKALQRGPIRPPCKNRQPGRLRMRSIAAAGGSMPLTMELLKLSAYAPSAITTGNQIANGAWILHLTKFLWDVVGERLVFTKDSACPIKAERRLYGVEVTNSTFFSNSTVEQAVEFAAAAHEGQRRRTGEPYVAHCIETACLVEALLSHADSPTLKHRSQIAVVAALLHDVVDDTPRTLEDIQAAFGAEVASMVQKVSKLSTMNQLLRRQRRQMSGRGRGIALASEDEERLRALIISMLDEPLALVIKLADRLHNMRTVFALRPDRQLAVAQETRQIWCSLAERLGMMALKSEMEDLCFTVLEPAEYRTLRQQLDQLWGTQSLPLAGMWEAALAGRRAPGLPGTDRLQQLALSSNAVSAQALQQARKVTLQQALESPVQPRRLKMRKRRQQQATASGLLQEAPRPAKRPVSNLTALLSAAAAVAAQEDGGGRGGATAVLEAPLRAGEDRPAMLPLTRRPDWGLHESGHLAGAQLQQPPGASPAAAGQAAAEGAPAEAGAASLDTGAGCAAPSSAPRDARQQEQRALEERQASGAAANSSGRGSLPDLSRLTQEQLMARELIVSVLPFDTLGFKDHQAVPQYAERGLKTLEGCAAQLLKELRLESLATGLDVRVEGRLKSLYSIARKMKRKGIPLEEVYDASALRVIVDDEGGARREEAVAACYRILTEAQRLWRKVPREFDDYIANPKPSGYRSLHTCVRGPTGVPMEVQVRTSSMHATAEFGQAAHWTYKENTPKLQAASHAVQEMQPVLCVTNGIVRHGVVLHIESPGEILVAVATASSGRDLPQTGSEETLHPYRALYEHAIRKQWWLPGHGDLSACLEAYALCKDGQWHRVDFTGLRLQQSTCTPLEAWAALQRPPGEAEAQAEAQRATPAPAPDRIDELQQELMGDKTRFLRSLLLFESEMLDNPSAGSTQTLVLLWPPGDILSLPKGTTAGQVDREHGCILLQSQEEAKQPPARRTVNVNNALVPEDYVLQDGDFVVLTRKRLVI